MLTRLHGVAWATAVALVVATGPGERMSALLGLAGITIAVAVVHIERDGIRP
jgi:hypothetical protein